MDRASGKDIVAKDLKPIYTVWDRRTVRKSIRAAKRRSRRAYKQYLKTGDIRAFDRSQRQVNRLCFD